MKILCFKIKYTGWNPGIIRQRQIRKAAKEYCDGLQAEAEHQIKRKILEQPIVIIFIWIIGIGIGYAWRMIQTGGF